MYKSFASCIASEVGADLDNIISTSILAALIKISDEIRSLKLKPYLSPVYVVEYNNCIIYQERYDVRFRSDVQKIFSITDGSIMETTHLFENNTCIL